MAQHQLAFSSIEICTAPHFSLLKAPYLLPSPQLFLFYGVYFAVFISGQAIVFVSPFSLAWKPLVSVCVCVCATSFELFKTS